jgi:hypothetical protein
MQNLGGGRFALADQIPGRFWVYARDPEGLYVTDRIDVEIRGPAEARRTLDVAPIEVQGWVAVGRLPIAGRLRLSRAQNYGRVHLPLAPDGTFRGRLPGAGAWEVEVDAGMRKLLSTEVEVLADERGRATVEIRLPATRLFGRIVDADGGSVRYGRVQIWTAGGPRVLLADQEGRFEALGLAPGRIGLRGAGQGGGCTGPGDQRITENLEIDLEEGRALGLNLKLLPTRKVLGRVVRSGGPVDARRRVEAVLASGAVLYAAGDEDGTFALDLPVGASDATLVASFGIPPVQIFRLRPEGGELRLELSGRKGNLDLELPAPGRELAAAGQALEVDYRGGLVPLHLLGDESLGSLRGKTLELRDLPPGRYRFCLGPVGFFDRIDPAARKNCADGRVRNGKTRRISLAR